MSGRFLTNSEEWKRAWREAKEEVDAMTPEELDEAMRVAGIGTKMFHLDEEIEKMERLERETAPPVGNPTGFYRLGKPTNYRHYRNKAGAIVYSVADCELVPILGGKGD